MGNNKTIKLLSTGTMVTSSNSINQIGCNRNFSTRLYATINQIGCNRNFSTRLYATITRSNIDDFLSVTLPVIKHNLDIQAVLARIEIYKNNITYRAQVQLFTNWVCVLSIATLTAVFGLNTAKNTETMEIVWDLLRSNIDGRENNLAVSKQAVETARKAFALLDLFKADYSKLRKNYLDELWTTRNLVGHVNTLYLTCIKHIMEKNRYKKLYVTMYNTLWEIWNNIIKK